MKVFKEISPLVLFALFMGCAPDRTSIGALETTGSTGKPTDPVAETSVHQAPASLDLVTYTQPTVTATPGSATTSSENWTLTWGGFAAGTMSYVSVNGGSNKLNSTQTLQGNQLVRLLAGQTQLYSWYLNSQLIKSYKFVSKYPAPTPTTTSVTTTYPVRTPRPTRTDTIPYDVGVDYHSTGTSLETTSFIGRYQDPAVRTLVRSQIQSMAAAGAKLMGTRVWMTSTEIAAPGATASSYQVHFPPTAQELANIRQYAKDVAEFGMKMELTPMRLWAASLDVGTPTTTLGYENLKPADFTARMQKAYRTIIDSVYDIKAKDGKPVVDTLYLDGEVQIAKKNTDWFLKSFYTDFVNYAKGKGLNPSVYFLVSTADTYTMQTTWVDTVYPELKGKYAVASPYKTLRFMKDNGMAMPSRVDFSYYILPKTYTTAQLIKRVLDDLDSLMPLVGAPKVYGIAETYYYNEPYLRQGIGWDLAAARGRLQRTSFWTTWNGGVEGQAVGFPFAINDYLP